MGSTFVAEIDAPGAPTPVRACVWEPSPPVFLFPSSGEYPVYDDFAYGQMLKDEKRMNQYAAAVQRYAPGRTVLDIGTGQDAVWALEAARAGAAHVYAIEVIPRSAQIARETIAKAGYADRVTVLEGLSTDVGLDEPVDVCVSEIIGCIGGSEGAGSVLRDAKKRLVKPGGVFIPHLSATTVQAIDMAAANEGEPVGLPMVTFPYVRQVFESVGRPFDLRLCLVGVQDVPPVRERAYLTDVALVEQLGFNTDTRIEGVDTGTVTFARKGRFHGLALGVRLWVTEGDPDPIDSLTEPSSWNPVYAPLSEVGLPVRAGDTFDFTFTTTLSDDGVHPDYALTGRLHRDVGPPVPVRWTSTHHADGFRAMPFYRGLFPGSTS